MKDGDREKLDRDNLKHLFPHKSTEIRSLAILECEPFLYCDQCIAV